MSEDKIWAHSGDSHLLEPHDLWHQIMPKAQADRMPRTERISDTEERVTVDGKMVDYPVVERARRLLARHDRARRASARQQSARQAGSPA